MNLATVCLPSTTQKLAHGPENFDPNASAKKQQPSHGRDGEKAADPKGDPEHRRHVHCLTSTTSFALDLGVMDVLLEPHPFEQFVGRLFLAALNAPQVSVIGA
jgi:hypothetical protein